MNFEIRKVVAKKGFAKVGYVINCAHPMHCVYGCHLFELHIPWKCCKLDTCGKSHHQICTSVAKKEEELYNLNSNLLIMSLT
jgi:hypothetical protein